MCAKKSASFKCHDFHRCFVAWHGILVLETLKILQVITGWWFEPLWKILVNWDDDIPNIWENKIHVPNHQPDKNELTQLLATSLRQHASTSPGANRYPRASSGTSSFFGTRSVLAAFQTTLEQQRSSAPWRYVRDAGALTSRTVDEVRFLSAAIFSCSVMKFSYQFWEALSYPFATQVRRTFATANFQLRKMLFP